MSKFSTLNYLINSYQAGKKEVELFHLADENSECNNLKDSEIEYEPSRKSVDAILSFAFQYEVLKSQITGNVELNLN